MEMKDWVCDRCKRTQRWIAVAKAVVLQDNPSAVVVVCAECHRDLWRAKQIIKENGSLPDRSGRTPWLKTGDGEASIEYNLQRQRP